MMRKKLELRLVDKCRSQNPLHAIKQFTILNSYQLNVAKVSRAEYSTVIIVFCASYIFVSVRT